MSRWQFALVVALVFAFALSFALVAPTLSNSIHNFISGIILAMTMTFQEFEQVVADTLDHLPPRFQEQLDNVAIIVEEWADPATLEAAGVSHPAQLLGFYHGIPLTARTHDYGMVLPDKISIYRQPLLRYYRTPEELEEGIRHTVLHELAHYFGVSDERLRELGAY